MMTIGDQPDLLARRLPAQPEHAAGRRRDHRASTTTPDIDTIVVRTRRQTDFEDKLKKKMQTSGCAQGTVFGDLMEEFDKIALERRRAHQDVLAL